MNNATYSIVIVLSQLHNIMFPIKELFVRAPKG